MSCKNIQKHLSALLDHELSPKEHALVTQHLNGCSTCRTYLGLMKAAIGSLDSSESMEPSVGFDAAFASKLADTKRVTSAERTASPLSFFRGWRIPAVATALAGACVVLVMFGLGPQRTDTTIAEADVALVKNMDLLADYDVIDNMDALEDFAVVSQLDALLGEDDR